jgi:hypothetical protein
MMDISEVAVPAVSAAGGATVTALALKLVIQSWFKRHDEVATKVDSMIIQLTRVEERVSTLQRTEERTHAQDRILAVIQAQIAEFRDDLNGVGRKVREMQT